MNWAEHMPLAGAAWRRHGRPDGALRAWVERLAAELVDGGAIALRDGVAHDR